MSVDEKQEISVIDAVPPEGSTETDGAGPEPRKASRVDERRLIRKLDMRIMPLISFLYLFACAYPDRGRSTFELILLARP